MSQHKYPTGLAPDVFIDQVCGELQIRGSAEAEMLVEAEPAGLSVDGMGNNFRLKCESNCDIRLPVDSVVHISEALGNVRLRSLEDMCSIEAVHGSLFLRNVADMEVEIVHGELIVRQVAGDLKIDEVHGNAIVRDVQGQCSLAKVHGNLDLHDVEGDVTASIQGNARVRLNSLVGSHYEIHADGNVHVRLPEDASLRIDLSSQAEMISIKLPQGSKLVRERKHSEVLGDGMAAMVIVAGGSIYLSAQESNWAEDERSASFDQTSAELGDRIARQVEAQIGAQMEAVNRQLSEQMANLSASIDRAGFSPEESERIMRKARESSERATAQAEEKMRRAQEKIERKLEAARRREEQRTQAADRWGSPGARPSWKFDFPAPPIPPVPREPASEEERLMILRMLAEKKISLEDADQLLSALEGKE